MASEQQEVDGPVSRQGMRAFQKERRGLEVELLDEVLRSRRVARIGIVILSAFSVMCLAVVIFVVWRYAQPIPEHILTLNKDTGEVQQVSLLPDHKESYGEVVDSFWVAQFVTHYESYDFYTVQADYNAVGLMAAPVVAGEYQKQFSGPKGKDRELGDSLVTRVHISSVILDQKAHIATVRFSTQDKVRARPLPEPEKQWIAIVGYGYRNVPMTAAQRFVNPLGFRVSSFRVQPVAVGGN